MTDYNIPLSPKSVTDEQIKGIGEQYRKELLTPFKLLLISNKLRKIFIITSIIGLIFFIIGSFFALNIVIYYDPEPSIYSNFNPFPIILMVVFYFIVVLMILICVSFYIDERKKAKAKSCEELGQEKLRIIFNQQIKNSNRVIDIPYYTYCEEIKNLGIKPEVYMLAGKFENINGADFLLDEQAGKFAICSTYESDVLNPNNVFDTNKLIAVKLSNNGRTIYETKTQDGFTRGVIGYAVAGSAGAIVAADTAQRQTISHTINDFEVLVTYNDLKRAVLRFYFGGNKTGAENLYQVFTVLCERNKK